MTVHSLLHQVVSRKRNLSISHQKLVREKRHPVKVQRVIQVSPTEVRYRILDDGSEETKAPIDTERPRAASPSKDSLSAAPFTERSDRCIPVHNLNREVRLFSRLKTPAKPHHSPSRSRPVSELRLRKQTFSRCESPGLRDKRADNSAILVQGSKCQYAKRSSETGAKCDDPLKVVDMWTVDVSKVPDVRGGSRLLHHNLRKYFRTNEKRRPRLQRSRGAASFTVFDMDLGKEAGTRAHSNKAFLA